MIFIKLDKQKRFLPLLQDKMTSILFNVAIYNKTRRGCSPMNFSQME